MIEFYKKLFNVREIEKDIALQLFGGAILLGFWVSFYEWETYFFISNKAVEYGEAACWPFFQNCINFYHLTVRPYGYAQNAFFLALLGVIFLGCYGLLSRKFLLAHSCIFFLFICQALIIILTYRYNANYYYYQIAFCIIFLFLPHKRFFASLSIVLFYFLSTATKIHESWTLGTYFTNLQHGLPFTPQGSEPFLTNIVILMEMVGAWFLFSSNKYIQRSVLGFFIFFHLYSGNFVAYNYPLIATPALIIFFGPLFKPFKAIPLNKKSIPGWLLCFLFLYLQMLSHMIPGDEKLTMEGNFYGHYMFEANHQCRVILYDNQNSVITQIDTPGSGKRCDPYLYFQKFRNKFCENKELAPYRFEILHSINGGPFYRIVNELDMCALTYHPFYHNDWIKTEDEAYPVGRPRKNYY
jgi:hypothetical protein